MDNSFIIEDEIINVDILQGSFIDFRIYENEYVVEANQQGINSFIWVLDELLKDEYNSIRLTGFQYTDYYTLTAECFFEEGSDCMDIIKTKNISDIVIFEDEETNPYNGEKNVLFSLNVELIKEIKKSLIQGINNTNSVSINVINKQKVVKKLNFIIVNKEAIRLSD